MTKHDIQHPPYDFVKRFELKGYRCTIAQHKQMGHLCGYVQLPMDFPDLTGIVAKGYDHPSIASLDVHGGVTFCNERDEHSGIWIGFDCAHCGDLVPSMAAEGLHLPDAEFRTPDFVRSGLAHLVTQLEERRHAVSP